MIINIPLQIDEKRMEEVIAVDYESKIIKELVNHIESVLKSKANYYSSSPNDGMKVIIEEQVYKYLDEYKDSIIDVAGRYLADRLAKTKRGKELLEEVAK